MLQALKYQPTPTPSLPRQKYPFGSVIPEFSYKNVAENDTAAYRYGFNNQEQDNELGEYYAFEYRIHDARIGRFLSIDPLEKKFPYWTPYQFAGNQVISSRDLEGLEAENDLNIFEEVDGPGMMDDGRSSTGTRLICGTISYSSAGMQIRVENAIREFNVVERTGIGKLLHKSDTKLVDNPMYQPAVAGAVNNALNRGKSLYFTDNILDILPYSDRTDAQGMMIMVNPSNFIIYATSVFDVYKVGTDPLWEEVFHMSNAINPRYSQNYTFENGKWGIYNNTALLHEEARAKHMVVTGIRGILERQFIHAYNTNGKTYGIYAHTSFGAMLGMTEAQILNFISTGKGTLHKYQVYEYHDWGNGRVITIEPGQYHWEIRTQEGIYDSLTR